MHSRCGVLLVNLGTPDSPRPRDVKRYLTEFLCDGRVIDLPWAWRQLLVRGFIIPRRFRESAKGYQAIWTEEGSPLLVHGRNLQRALQTSLGDDFCVKLAMRYGNPSIADGLKSLIDAQVSKIIILPLFPQYASATTGSVQQKVMEEISRWKVIPKVLFIDQYYERDDLTTAFASIVDKTTLHAHDEVLFSFHGLPQRHLSDISKSCYTTSSCCDTISACNRTCYSAQCYHMARAIASKLDLASYKVSFQSRLGKEPWLQPYTTDVIMDAARAGKKNLLVFSPSFVCDCLETLYEIKVEYAHAFTQAGGHTLTLVPGLNTHPAWIRSLTSLVMANID
jgi:ferrochelatase